jgi:hypothetical protein
VIDLKLNAESKKWQKENLNVPSPT